MLDYLRGEKGKIDDDDVVMDIVTVDEFLALFGRRKPTVTGDYSLVATGVVSGDEENVDRVNCGTVGPLFDFVYYWGFPTSLSLEVIEDGAGHNDPSMVFDPPLCEECMDRNKSRIEEG